MRIWITGDRGLLGTALKRVLSVHGHTLGTWNRGHGDITDALSLNAAVDAFHPQVVIHLAAFTAVDRCESESEEAFRVNESGTRVVAQAAERTQAACVVLSTDYVFDGAKRVPYTEQDSTHPLSVYGKTKLRAESVVQDVCTRWVIVRTSWLYGSDGPNFVRRILDVAREGKELRVVNDQTGSPTYVPHLAEALTSLVGRGGRGLYHLAGQGSATWYDLACEAFSRSGLDANRIIPVSTDQFPRPARRPPYSVLSSDKAERELDLSLPDWRQGTKDYLDTP